MWSTACSIRESGSANPRVVEMQEQNSLGAGVGERLEPTSPELISHGRHPFHQALIGAWQIPTGRIGILILTVIVLAAIAAPLITQAGPDVQFRGHELEAPSLSHVFGTDNLGRDMFSRVVYGARTSLLAGVMAVFVGASVGISTGLFAGYAGGWVDATIMRFYDALLTFPTILLAIVVVTIMGPSLLGISIAIGIAQMPLDARLTRSVVLSQRERDYVLAARSLGATGRRIAIFHILPNTLPVLLVQLSLSMGAAVLTEGGLSFLGLGTQPPTPSWGGMLDDSRAYMRDAPWFGFWPGLMLALLLVALNYLSDALRDAMDPRTLSRRGGRL
jgi:peptide/nickel transport system permease protein